MEATFSLTKSKPFQNMSKATVPLVIPYLLAFIESHIRDLNKQDH